MLFLVIVLLNGNVVRINPHEVIALIAAQEDVPNKHYTPEVRCIIQTTSGGEYTTREDCISIDKRLQELREGHSQ